MHWLGETMSGRSWIPNLSMELWRWIWWNFSVKGWGVVRSFKNRHASHEFTKNVNANIFAGNEAFVTWCHSTECSMLDLAAIWCAHGRYPSSLLNCSNTSIVIQLLDIIARAHQGVHRMEGANSSWTADQLQTWLARCRVNFSFLYKLRYMVLRV